MTQRSTEGMFTLRSLEYSVCVLLNVMIHVICKCSCLLVQLFAFFVILFVCFMQLPEKPDPHVWGVCG